MLDRYCTNMWLRNEFKRMQKTCNDGQKWGHPYYKLMRLGQLGVVEGGRRPKHYSRPSCKRLFALIINEGMVGCSTRWTGDVAECSRTSKLSLRLLLLLLLLEFSWWRRVSLSSTPSDAEAIRLPKRWQRSFLEILGAVASESPNWASLLRWFLPMLFDRVCGLKCACWHILI